MTSGKEMQLNFKEFSFPVRPGHRLILAKDDASQDWERLVNETTGETSYANGIFNPQSAAQRRSHAKEVIFLAIGLLIPILNFLVGLYAIAFILTKVPVKIGTLDVPGAKTKAFLSFVSGLSLFSLSWVVLIGFTDSRGSIPFVFKYGSLVAIYFCFSFFKKVLSAPILQASKLISEKSELLDNEVAQFRAKAS